MALTRDQYTLLEEVDEILRHAPHIQRVSLYPEQWARWKEILKRMRPSTDPRFDFDGSRYRGRKICKLGEEQ